MADTHKQLISVVIPVFNEEKCVEALFSRIRKTVESMPGWGFEVIYIDDHSSDSSLSVLRRLHQQDPRVKIISFSRNFGHQIAITAGLHYASGDCVVLMDGDLQDPPELICKMLDKWKQGFDVVYGIRRHRKERIIKRLCYSMFYLLLNKISPLHIPRDAGDFCLMDKRVVTEMKKFSEEKPFVRGLRTWVGFKQTGIEYDRLARKLGNVKYTPIKLIELAFDGILSFSNIVLRMAAIVGFILSFSSLVYALYISIYRILIAWGIADSTRLIPGWTSLACAVFFLMGVQLIFMGILGEYVGRIFMQVKQRPLYVVQEEIGFRNDR